MIVQCGCNIVPGYSLFVSKNYMLKAGGTFVDIKDSACLEENSRELKVLIRRKHLPSVHR